MSDYADSASAYIREMVASWDTAPVNECIENVHRKPISCLAHQYAYAAHLLMPGDQAICEDYDAQALLKTRAVETYVSATGGLTFVFREPWGGFSAIVSKPSGDAIYPRWG